MIDARSTPGAPGSRWPARRRQCPEPVTALARGAIALLSGPVLALEVTRDQPGSVDLLVRRLGADRTVRSAADLVFTRANAMVYRASLSCRSPCCDSRCRRGRR